MGVRILEGTYDGTTHAAVMVDSVTETPVGDIWTGPEAVEQIEQFMAWMQKEPWLRGEIFDALELEKHHLPRATSPAWDPRAWPSMGLERLLAYWRKQYLDEDGFLKDETAGLRSV